VPGVNADDLVPGCFPCDQQAAISLPPREDVVHTDHWVGICLNWPAGLIRRAVLEAGARLTHKGLIQHPEHAVERAPDEVGPLLFSGTGPTASQLAERASWRDEIERAVPPSRLGSPETPPPLDALPAPMA
jgi:hypothetical protein